MRDDVLIGRSKNLSITQLCSQSNRHGLITGTQGSGKTATVQMLAEGFSKAGVPVFATDVKGDLAGMAAAGQPDAEIDRRCKAMGLDAYEPCAYPTLLWDIAGKFGRPLQTSVTQMGPLILNSLLELDPQQSKIIDTCFAVADQKNMLLADLSDLGRLLDWIAGGASLPVNQTLTIDAFAAVKQQLLAVQRQGADSLFGPADLRITDLMQKDLAGDGVVSLLQSETLLCMSSRIYAVYVLWLLSELFDDLPVTGDLERPKLVFFIDEAQLLFDQMPSYLVDRIGQVVRLIRAKAVGVYFITQNPADVPRSVLDQLGLQVTHAVQVSTPRDYTALKAAAATFRNDDNIDIAAALQTLGPGEALVSTLDDFGVPSSVTRTLIAPPESRIGQLSNVERCEFVNPSVVGHKVKHQAAGALDLWLENATPADRESAYAVLSAMTTPSSANARNDQFNAVQPALQATPSMPSKKSRDRVPKGPSRQNTVGSGDRVPKPKLERGLLGVAMRGVHANEGRKA